MKRQHAVQFAPRSKVSGASCRVTAGRDRNAVMRAHQNRLQASFTFDPGTTDTPHKDRQQDPAQVTCEGHRRLLTRACGICNSAVLLAFLNGPCGNANNIRRRGRPYERDFDRQRSQDRLPRTTLICIERCKAPTSSAPI